MMLAEWFPDLARAAAVALEQACPYTGKFSHATKGAAMLHMKSLRLTPRCRDGASLRVYQCACGAWHVGHDPARTTKTTKTT